MQRTKTPPPTVSDMVTTLRYYDERIEKGERLYRACLRAERIGGYRAKAEDTALLVDDAVLVDGEDEQDWGDTFAVLASIYGFTPGTLEGFPFGQVKAYANRAHLMEERRGDAHAQSLVPLVNAMFPK